MKQLNAGYLHDLLLEMYFSGEGKIALFDSITTPNKYLMTIAIRLVNGAYE